MVVQAAVDPAPAAFTPMATTSKAGSAVQAHRTSTPPPAQRAAQQLERLLAEDTAGTPPQRVVAGSVTLTPAQGTSSADRTGHTPRRGRVHGSDEPRQELPGERQLRMAVAVQADYALQRMADLQSEVVQINSATDLLRHERQQKMETFMDEFSTQIDEAIRAYQSLRDAYVAAVDDSLQRGVHPVTSPNPSGPPSVASSGARTAHTQSPQSGAAFFQLVHSTLQHPAVVSAIAEAYELNSQQ